MSEHALDVLAQKVYADEPVVLPCRVGVFTIRQVGRKPDGSVYLWTKPNPAGSSGFVRGFTEHGYNLWTALQLSKNWHHVEED